MKDLAGKVVLITGAAGGIGKAMSLEFGRKGARPVLVDIDEGGLEEAADELRGLGFDVMTIVADLASAGEAEGIVDRAIDERGQIDVLVNNAGTVFGGPVEQITTDQVTTTLHVNLRAPILATKRVLPHMKQRGSGHIVNICSLAGWAAPPRTSVYSATKGGLISFTDSIMQELYGTGVKTTVVSPNLVTTGLFEGCKKHPLWQWTTPQVVAQRVVRAVEKNQAEIYVPSYMWIWTVLRAICMAKFAYFLGRIVRAQRMTSKWGGRKPA